MTLKTINLLLVEDNEADAVLVEKIFQSSQHNCEIVHAEDGDVAMDLLNDVDTPNPHIILLDINMPKKDGKTVLRDIKLDDNLKHIPVIMLTSSNAVEDIMDCYSLCASSYVVKPSSVEDQKKLLSAFDAFWFDFAALPEQKPMAKM